MHIVWMLVAANYNRKSYKNVSHATYSCLGHRNISIGFTILMGHTNGENTVGNPKYMYVPSPQYQLHQEIFLKSALKIDE